uniref:Uncharacterized protein n=1 Tax=Oryzias melastigma TaxID=30732 RepID=A0A3B3BPI5_ORYME
EQFWQTEAEHLDSAANSNNMSCVYSLLRQSRNGPRIKSALVKDSDGNLITTETNYLQRWKEHFSPLLQHKNILAPSIIPAYADDTILFSSSYSQLRDALSVYSEEAKKLGLHVNGTKTKFMHVGEGPDSLSILLGNDTVEPVKNFVYLGSNVADYGDLKPEILLRGALAASALQSLRKPLWRHKSISRKMKLRIYNSTVLSILLYGSETWPLNKTLHTACITVSHTE